MPEKTLPFDSLAPYLLWVARWHISLSLAAKKFLEVQRLAGRRAFRAKKIGVWEFVTPKQSLVNNRSLKDISSDLIASF